MLRSGVAARDVDETLGFGRTGCQYEYPINFSGRESFSKGSSFRPMQTHRTDCTIATTNSPEFIDITEQVDRALDSAHVGDGHVTITVPEGCAIVVNEYESGLLSDLKRVIAELESSTLANRRVDPPFANGSEPRIGSSSVVLPASDGKLRLGRWQRLLLVELEKSTDRCVNIQIVGD